MKFLIVANWKCNPVDLAQAKWLFNSLKRGLKQVRKSQIVICPPFVFLSNLAKIKSNCQMGAQNCFWEPAGAFTGEISPLMLKNLKIKYVIIGHSERRRYLKEGDEMVNWKLKSALKFNLRPILCLGETSEQKRKGLTQSILKEQLQNALKGISKKDLTSGRLVIAYEPIWSIGTGQACQPEDVQQVRYFLKKQLKIKQILFLYGGSVKAENAVDYLSQAGCQGLLVGGASLDPQEFLLLVKNIERNVDFFSKN